MILTTWIPPIILWSSMSVEKLVILVDVVEASAGVAFVSPKQEDLLADGLANGTGAGDFGFPGEVFGVEVA